MRSASRARMVTGLVAVAAAALTLPASLGPAQAEAPHGGTDPVVVPATAPELVYLGRWGRDQGTAWTVNSGSRVVLRFTGRRVAGLFDQSQVTYPPQVYASVDGSRARLLSVDRDRIELSPRGLGPGTHTLVLAVKDVDERANRWTQPLLSGLGLKGFELAPGGHAAPAGAPRGPRLEFLGDSITQGVRAVGPQIGVEGSDATQDYAWLTGTALGGNFRQVGFGAQGITRAGGGGVPAAPETLGLNYAGSPVDSAYVPQAVVINQGTNDFFNDVSGAVFEPAYLAYLRDVRARWPQAWIFAVRPFGGYLSREIEAAVAATGDARIRYVDTTGWIPQEQLTDGLHPTAVGHRTAARRLTREIVRQTGWRAAAVPKGSAPLLAAGGEPGFEGSDRTTWRAGGHVRAVSVATTDTAYHGSSVLAVESTVAPLGEWRTIKLKRGTAIPLPRRAKDLYAFVSVTDPAVTTFDVRVRAVRGGRTYTQTTYDILNLAPFLPWDRVSVDVPGHGKVTALSISVRAEGASTAGELSFDVDDLGWTDTANRTSRIPLPRGVR
ncbi:MAG: GDSL-type esterase/lipase family protein [Propionibacteriaceae bacterium]